ncbi:MAG: SIMPL domain-containing protein [Candidatus Woesebacteria bacterium]|nr:SIMPL domain-containing protein [Candidatus Woesebacteria bacterium]
MKENKISFAGKIIIFFILLFLFAKWGPAINFSTTTQTKGEPFVTQGTGKVTVAPDIAKIDLGIQESGTNLKTVQDSVNKKSQDLTGQIKKLGIAANDIKTISYYVYPQYDYTAPAQRITGYEVSTSYEVTIRDFTKINELIASATSFGANTIGGVNFDLSDNLKKEKLQEARSLAVTEAKDKASGLAKAAGITLGKIINVTEETPSNIRPLMLPTAGGGVTDKSITQPAVQPGTTDINVTVSLAYEVR